MYSYGVPHMAKQKQDDQLEYKQQLREDTGCSPEDMPEAINDSEKWRNRVKDIRASGTTWWWWWFVGAELIGFKYSNKTLIVLFAHS